MPFFGLSPFVVKAIGYGLAVLAVICCLAAIFFHIESLGEAKEEAKTAQGVAKLAQDNAAKSAQLAATNQGIAHDAQLQASASRADAARATTARDAFRVQLHAYVRAGRGSQPAGPPSGSEAIPGGDPIGVLADMLAGADARADVTEGLADARGIRAAACERAYDSARAQLNAPAKP